MRLRMLCGNQTAPHRAAKQLVDYQKSCSASQACLACRYSVASSHAVCSALARLEDQRILPIGATELRMMTTVGFTA